MADISLPQSQQYFRVTVAGRTGGLLFYTRLDEAQVAAVIKELPARREELQVVERVTVDVTVENVTALYHRGAPPSE